MTFAFTCTFEDYVEASRIHRSLARGQRTGLGERLLFLWILLVMLALFFAVAIAQGIYAGATSAAPVAGQVSALDWMIALVVPVMLWTIWFGLIWYGFSGVLVPTERRSFQKVLLLILAALFAMNLVEALISGVPAREARHQAPPATSDRSFLAAFTPWLVFCLIIWFVLVRHVRGAARRNWDAQAQLRLPQTLEQTERGLRFVDEHTTCDYAWSAFAKYREGPNVFLLYVSDVGFQMVPKRAMSDAALVDAFRAFVAQHVACIDPGPTGFAVQQPVPMAPQPVVPIQS